MPPPGIVKIHSDPKCPSTPNALWNQQKLAADALDLERSGCINPHPSPPPSWGRVISEDEAATEGDECDGSLHLPAPKMGLVRVGVDAAVLLPRIAIRSIQREI
jgi:hypothetical protein